MRPAIHSDTPTVTALPTSFHRGPLRRSCPSSAAAVHPRGNPWSSSASPIPRVTRQRPRGPSMCQIAGGDGMPIVDPAFSVGDGVHRPAEPAEALGPVEPERVGGVVAVGSRPCVVRVQDRPRVLGARGEHDHPATSLRNAGEARVHDAVRPPVAERVQLAHESVHRFPAAEGEHVRHVLDQQPSRACRRRTAASTRVRSVKTKPDWDPAMPAVRPAWDRSVQGNPAATTSSLGGIRGSVSMSSCHRSASNRERSTRAAGAQFSQRSAVSIASVPSAARKPCSMPPIPANNPAMRTCPP